ncbi:hypothetical protein [Glaciimonas immobilis]|uniref:Uncharacterized protein n=1 Tax=Glaciimonas immobilis TaxID=728004 RepID=A0A840RSK6_9BURK|nr:hypothetical protein [Glaciimonas immobilis]KAF3997531.1 hypothetical protein HAV38_12695 [Glaciimonas immobilis]MBB5200785.1 hypothetical protein [Glaciimonas immobilis]
MTITAQQLAAQLTTTHDDGHDFFDRALLKSDLSASDMIELADAALEVRVIDDKDFIAPLNALRADRAYADEVSALLFSEYKDQKAEYLAALDE